MLVKGLAPEPTLGVGSATPLWAWVKAIGVQIQDVSASPVADLFIRLARRYMTSHLNALKTMWGQIILAPASAFVMHSRL